MIVNFEIKSMECITDCPNGMQTTNGKPIKTGSILCEMCKFFKGGGSLSKKVLCKAPEKKNNEPSTTI